VPASDQLAIDECIEDRYTLLSQLGSGGYGTVYLAHDRELDTLVAVKVLSGAFAGQWAQARKQRFLREGKALAVLDHKGIVRIKRIALLPDGRPYMVMELVEGHSLSTFIEREGTLNCKQATKICIDIAEALAHAHEKGILHRDIKPGNIIVAQEDGDITARVLDFGLSSLDLAGVEEQSKLTQTGDLLGTPTYMAPERSKKSTPDARADIYSLGCVFFEMLVGEPPFTGDNPLAIMWSQANSPLPKLAEIDPDAEFPVELQEILEQATAKEPENRYQNVEDMLNDLRSPALLASTARIKPAQVAANVRPPTPTVSRKRPPIVLAGAGLTLLLCVLSASAVVASPTLAAKVTSFLATRVSLNCAAGFAGGLARFESTLQGPAAVDALASDTLPEITNLGSSERLAITIAFFDALGPGVDAERDWPIVCSVIQNGLAALREHDTSRLQQAIDALDRASAVLARSSLSKEHWSLLLPELTNNTGQMIKQLTDNHRLDVHDRLTELVAAGNLKSPNGTDERAIFFYLRLAQTHKYDRTDQPFNRYMENLVHLTAEHPSLIDQTLETHKIQAERYRYLGKNELAAIELAKAAELEHQLQQTQRYSKLILPLDKIQEYNQKNKR
jgi:serine/threonine protein kinase